MRGSETQFSEDFATRGVDKPRLLNFSVFAKFSGVTGANPSLMCITDACLNNSQIHCDQYEIISCLTCLMAESLEVISLTANQRSNPLKGKLFVFLL